MAVENFAPSLAKVLKHEGGFVDNPKDPGGATNKGVTQGVYDRWRQGRNLEKRSVKLLTDDELRHIYRREFWDSVRGDELPLGIDYVVFDGSVNSGPSQSAKWLQRALEVTADGKVGPETVKAAVRSANRAGLIKSMLAQRLTFMKRIKNKKTGALLWPTFGRGWQARVDEVRAVALEMAAQPPVAGTEPAPEPEVVVVTTTVSHPKPKGLGGWVWGGVVAVLAAVLSFMTSCFSGGTGG